MKHNSAYATLLDRFTTAGKLSAARQMLLWDSQVGMPPGGAWARGEEIAAILDVCADLIAAPDATDLFEAAAEEADHLPVTAQASLAEMRRVWRRTAAVPKALQMEKARLCSSLRADWPRAKATNDFGLFAPGFERLLTVHREIAAATGEALELAPYDALMDERDPGLTTALADPIFDEFEAKLPTLLADVAERQAGWPQPRPFTGNFSQSRQHAFSLELLRVIGHFPDHARLDPAANAFTTPESPGDIRMTVRFDVLEFRTALRSTLHEAGHGLYHLGLPREDAFLPSGAPRGATANEGQALMLEMQAGRSHEFLAWLAPRLATAFGGNPQSWSFANLLNACRRVGQGFIRTEADEISYPLHVVLRYRLERALLSGDLAVADLPGAWSDLSERLFSRRPPDHARGCLQDVHWSSGYFGYFPTYALGAAMAAQLFEAAVRDNPDIQPGLGRGDFASYRDWTRAKIHARASAVDFTTLIEDAAGAPLSAAPLLRHLRRRYLEEAAPAA